jgi:hypothetical protein
VLAHAVAFPGGVGNTHKDPKAFASLIHDVYVHAGRTRVEPWAAHAPRVNRSHTPVSYVRSPYM